MSKTTENNSEKNNNKFNVAVLVVGDLNRSPRMLNHCVSLTQAYEDINEISLIGYNGGDIRSDISSNEKIKRYSIWRPFDKLLKKLPRFLFILVAFIKIVIQILSLGWILLRIPKYRFLILQNPPGIPAMFICWLMCHIRRSKFIIDWHNYGYTILEVNKRPKFMVKLAYKYEKFFSTKSDLNFCVSQAEKRDLKKQFGIEAVCLPDRPVKDLFKFLNEEEANELYKKYPNELSSLIDSHLNKQKKPIVMISSTSWTPDEDFNILLDAFIKTEEMIFSQIENKDDVRNKSIIEIDKNKLKKVLFLITGRGPLRDSFMKKVSESNLKIFDVKSIWLESDDYPKLLSLVDLGISLHYSSSGIDLPMKVVDMFSGCLPVAAIYYETIEELVEEDKNGFLFKSEKELCKILNNVIIEYSMKGNCEKIIRYKEYLHKELNKNDWTSQWIQRVKPAIQKKNII